MWAWGIASAAGVDKGVPSSCIHLTPPPQTCFVYPLRVPGLFGKKGPRATEAGTPSHPAVYKTRVEEPDEDKVPYLRDVLVVVCWGVSRGGGGVGREGAMRCRPGAACCCWEAKARTSTNERVSQAMKEVNMKR